MLDDAVAAFLDAVSERAFDEPLLALLRVHGYQDVHLVHGKDEFGKDVIAKRDGQQLAIQSKAGNISLPGWRDLTGQLDELRRYDLSHPSFDTSLPRRCVLVTTGRLNSPAALAAQEYDRYFRSKGEPGIEVWDRDTLIDMLCGSPSAALCGSTDGELLSLLGSIAQRRVDMDNVEQFSRRWTGWDHSRLVAIGVVELGLAAEALAAGDRLDLACHLALGLVRAAWAADDSHAAASVVADAAASMFVFYARVLRDVASVRVSDRRGLFRGVPAPNWATYPVRATRLGELLGLLALWERQTEGEQPDETEEVLLKLAATHPGSAHPISDRYATCLIPFALALGRRHESKTREMLRRATVWLADRHDDASLGLAADDAEPDQELARLFGGPFEAIELSPRRDSYLAAVLADLAAVLKFADLYDDIRNEALAVDIVATTVVVDDVRGQYLRHGEGVFRVLPIAYVDEWPGNDRDVAVHHAGTPDGYALGRLGRAWDQLAVQAVTRDRHRVEALRTFV